MDLKYLRKNKIAIRIRNFGEAKVLHNKYPFDQFVYLEKYDKTGSMALSGNYPYTVSYYKSDDGYSGTHYNNDNGQYERDGYEVISLYKIIDRIKFKIKLPKINGT